MPDDNPYVPLLFWYNNDTRLALPVRYIIHCNMFPEIYNNAHLYPELFELNDVNQNNVLLTDDPTVYPSKLTNTSSHFAYQ